MKYMVSLGESPQAQISLDKMRRMRNENVITPSLPTELIIFKLSPRREEYVGRRIASGIIQSTSRNPVGKRQHL